jgi:hypothetical protein
MLQYMVYLTTLATVHEQKTTVMNKTTVLGNLNFQMMWYRISPEIDMNKTTVNSSDPSSIWKLAVFENLAVFET